MTEDERRDLLVLKRFLEKAIDKTEDDLINFSIDGNRDDYRFMIDKAIMYRENYKQVLILLKDDVDYE